MEILYCVLFTPFAFSIIYGLLDAYRLSKRVH